MLLRRHSRAAAMEGGASALTFNKLQLTKPQYVSFQTTAHARFLPHPYGAQHCRARPLAYVPEAVCQGDVAARRGLHRNSAPHIVLHRRGNLHTDKAQHTVAVDATVGVGLHHARDNAAGILLVNNVSHPRGQSGQQHSVRAWHHEGDAADRRPRHNGRELCQLPHSAENPRTDDIDALPRDFL